MVLDRLHSAALPSIHAQGDEASPIYPAPDRSTLPTGEPLHEATRRSSLTTTKALFYHLRTFRDEILGVKRLASSHRQVAAARASEAANGGGADAAGPTASPAAGAESASQSAQATSAAQGTQVKDPVSKQAWDYLEEIVQILKTMFPLLTLSMETLVDQINTKFKLNLEEEYYRNICLLLHDASTMYVSRTNVPDDDGLLKQASIDNMRRVHANMPASPAKVRPPASIIPYFLTLCRLTSSKTSCCRSSPTRSTCRGYRAGAIDTSEVSIRGRGRSP